MKTETHSDAKPPRFTPPPPDRGAPPALLSPWPRLAALTLGGWLLTLLAKRMMQAGLTLELTRLSDALGRMPELAWLPVLLLMMAATVSAAVGLREPQRRARSLLPLLGLTALPLLLGALLGAWG